jgi:hypothetical protein
VRIARRERLREVARRGEAVGGELLERAQHRGVHVRRHGAPQRRRRARLLGHELRQRRLRRQRVVRRLAGQHLVGHRAERVHVGAAVDHAVARGLLGAHVLRGAQREPRLRHPLAAGLAHRERDPEVGDHRLAVVQQDVLRLEVAVDHPVPVRVVHRARDGHGKPHRLVDGELALALEPRA